MLAKKCRWIILVIAFIGFGLGIVLIKAESTFSVAGETPLLRTIPVELNGELIPGGNVACGSWNNHLYIAVCTESTSDAPSSLQIWQVDPITGVAGKLRVFSLAQTNKVISISNTPLGPTVLTRCFSDSSLILRAYYSATGQAIDILNQPVPLIPERQNPFKSNPTKMLTANGLSCHIVSRADGFYGLVCYALTKNDTMNHLYAWHTYHWDFSGKLVTSQKKEILLKSGYMHGVWAGGEDRWLYACTTISKPHSPGELMNAITSLHLLDAGGTEIAVSTELPILPSAIAADGDGFWMVNTMPFIATNGTYYHLDGQLRVIAQGELPGKSKSVKTELAVLTNTPSGVLIAYNTRKDSNDLVPNGQTVVAMLDQSGRFVPFSYRSFNEEFFPVGLITGEDGVNYLIGDSLAGGVNRLTLDKI